jgi:hypothetical protein
VPDRSSTAEVIADRYLTSPSRLRARPFGPVDALDTHAGRAAQVRIVFTSGEWDGGELAEAVSRWCGIGAAGVCGVLDFGRHGDRWFLVLPPSLGTPVERWRSMRRPSAADAATLALTFGRLLESVAAAGFDAGSGVVADFAVGPGPTPFLEQPLLAPPRAAVLISRRAGGQEVLAALFDAAVDEKELPPQLSAWRAAAASGAHPSLSACLDALEQAEEAVRSAASPAEPAGLAGIFDGPLVLPAALSWPERLRRLGPLAALVPLVLVGLALVIAVRHPTAAATTQSNAGSAPRVSYATRPPAQPDVAHKRTPAKHKVVSRRRHRTPPAPASHRRRHPSAAHRAAPAGSHSASTGSAPTSPPPASPRATSSPPASVPSSPSRGVVLPAPGGTVLPRP